VDNDHRDFYANCLRAVAEQSFRVILSVGENTDIASLGEIPPNCLVKPSVDQMGVLQCADVFVTHCGMNSVSEGLYYGVPLVLFPRTPEQQGVANRVHDLHAGIFPDGETPEAICKAVTQALTLPEIKAGAAAIQQSFQQCGGAAEAADVIEMAKE
jgi:MGT family glycosyltransferase